MGCARHIDVGLNVAPRFLACHELNAEFVCIVLRAVSAGSSHFEHVVDFFAADAVRIVDIAVRSADGQHFAAELADFFARAPSHIAEAGDCKGLAFDALAFVSQNFLQEIGCAEARCFRTNEAAAVAEAFAGQNAVFIAAFDFLYCPKR